MLPKEHAIADAATSAVIGLEPKEHGLLLCLDERGARCAWGVSLHFMHYNFARVHQTLKTTPAVAAGVADHVWTTREIAALLD
jgi:hypothetical protein